MDNQDVVFETPAKKKSYAGIIVAVLSIVMALLGGLGFGFVYFIWPTVASIAAFVTAPVFLLIYVPVLNLVPMAILGVVDIVIGWFGYLTIGVIVAAVAVSVVNLFVISKNGGKIAAIVSVVISALVLLSIVLITVVSVICDVLLGSFVLGLVGLGYIAMMLVPILAL